MKFVYLHLVVALSSSKISLGISVEQYQSRIGFHDNLSPLMWNVHYGYLFESLKTVYLLFAIRLSSVHDRWEAVRTDWIIHSEKFLVIRTASAIRSKTIFIHSNGWGHLFERRRLSFWTAEVIHLKKIVIRSNGLGYPFKKKWSSVWTAVVICSKKIFIRSNSLGYPFKKNGHPFELLMLSVWKKLEWFERLMSTVPEKSILFSCSNSHCASVHSHKTIINQLFNRPTIVSDGIQVFERREILISDFIIRSR